MVMIFLLSDLSWYKNEESFVFHSQEISISAEWYQNLCWQQAEWYAITIDAKQLQKPRHSSMTIKTLS